MQQFLQMAQRVKSRICFLLQIWAYTTEVGPGGIWTHNILNFGKTPKPSCLGVRQENSCFWSRRLGALSHRDSEWRQRYAKYADELCSEKANGRVLNLKLYTHNDNGTLICLHLVTDLINTKFWEGARNRPTILLLNCVKNKSSARRQKVLTGWCFKYKDRPFCLRTNKIHFHWKPTHIAEFPILSGSFLAELLLW